MNTWYLLVIGTYLPGTNLIPTCYEAGNYLVSTGHKTNKYLVLVGYILVSLLYVSCTYKVLTYLYAKSLPKYQVFNQINKCNMFGSCVCT